MRTARPGFKHDLLVRLGRCRAMACLGAVWSLAISDLERSACVLDARKKDGPFPADGNSGYIGQMIIWVPG